MTDEQNNAIVDAELKEHFCTETAPTKAVYSTSYSEALCRDESKES
jgi:hypothetical protein